MVESERVLLFIEEAIVRLIVYISLNAINHIRDKRVQRLDRGLHMVNGLGMVHELLGRQLWPQEQRDEQHQPFQQQR